MKRNLLLLIPLMVLAFVPLSHAYPIDVDEIIWQADAGLNPSSLSATVEFEGINNNQFLITLTNTSSLSTPIDYPATVLLTGLGFNLPTGYSIDGGLVDPTNATNFTGSTASQFWGYDNYELNSGPFLNVTTLSVNTAVSTLEAAVEPGGAFASGGVIDGPKHGILSEAYSHDNYPYFDGHALITVNLNLNVAPNFETFVEDWDNFFADIDIQDVVVSFGSPTAPVPEPATMLLLGSGLIGLAGLGRKKLFKRG